jgi:hypothetical protein
MVGARALEIRRMGPRVNGQLKRPDEERLALSFMAVTPIGLNDAKRRYLLHIRS